MSDDLSMPWGSDSPATDESPTLDSPVAALNHFSSEDEPTYGSNREQRLSEVSEASESTSDDIDVRQLFDNPTVNLLRWQYRQNGMASTVVDKPVKDAFKHGFEFNASEDVSTVEEWMEETYVPIQKEARIKARRDGFSLVFWVLEDSNSVSDEVGVVNGIADLRVITLDELVRGKGNPRHDTHGLNDTATAATAAEHLEYDEEQLVVTTSGLVVVDDITSPDHHDFVGVMYKQNPKLSTDDHHQFIHADRLQPYVNRPYVDGDVEDSVYGHIEGDSTLAPIIYALTGITKAEWALGQTLLRYTAPLHVVEIDGDAQPKDGDWEAHISDLNDQLDNINNKSSLTLPPSHSAKTMSVEGDIDPEPFLDGLINDICAGAEITRSVLLGTQAGTVSGSSTDIKNYYNQVERYRDGDAAEKMHEAAQMYGRFTSEDVSVPRFDIEWGPLFRIEDAKRAEGMQTIMTAVSNGISNYILSQEQAQEILEQEWAEFEVEVDLESLTEEEMDQLDRINTTKGKQFPEGASSEQEVEEYSGKRSSQNGGGRDGGNTTDPSSPATDSHDHSPSGDGSDPSNPT